MALNPLRRYGPRSLYARAATILLLPVITLQVVLSVVFIQRLFEDVTVQMTGNVALELRYLRDLVDDAPDLASARAAAGGFAEDMRYQMALPDPIPAEDERTPLDLSGRAVIATFRNRLPNLTGVDLVTAGRQVHVSLTTRHGPLGVILHRDRLSAANPHQLLVITLLTGGLMSLVAIVFLRNQLRPIRRLADAASAFGRGHVVRYRPAGATEVRLAGHAFLDMRARIERHVEQRTMMLSGVSHDLRTPLTRLKLALSMMDGPDAREMERDVDEMQQMLDGFLDFAREGTLDDPVQSDPARILHDVAAAQARAGRVVELHRVEEVGAMPLRPLSITRALDNLVGNAVRYGSRAELSLSRSARTVIFTVEDDGPGIPEAARETAMRAFSRLDEARNQDKGSGLGLGLAIAADIARQHGGRLCLGTSRRLGGLKADLILGA